jgi:CDP-glucose 4,6-dehydratase
MLQNFWYGKRVLISGGDGFVASNLASHLIKQKANVVIAVRHIRPIKTFDLLTVGDNMPDFEMNDLSDFIYVQKLCNRHQIDTIFHLAASAIVSDASNAPMTTFWNNIIPTLNLLETARINKIPRILIASSDKSYGDHADSDDPERIPYREVHALRGMDVYSSSKVCADIISQTYALQYKLPVIVVRSCNIYGPGDLNFTRLIPRTILRLLSDSQPVINEGNQEVKREYIYIDDLVKAYQFLAEHVGRHYKEEIPRFGRKTYGWIAYNVGSYAGPSGPPNTPHVFRPEKCPNIRSVIQVIDEIKKKLDKKDFENKVIPKSENFIEIPDQYLDSSKLLKIGFKTEIDFNKGLDRTIEWYKKHKDYLLQLGYKYLKD